MTARSTGSRPTAPSSPSTSRPAPGQKVSQLSEALPKDTPITVDFNPVADRLRVIDGMGKSVGWLVSGGALHTVDLMTGKATAVGPIAGLKGKVTDIAILPAM